MTETIHFSEETCAHPGRKRYNFERQGRRWSLLTIDTGRDGEPPHSLLSPRDSDRQQPWPHFYIRNVDGIISVPAAALVIDVVYTAWRAGIDHGRKIKAAEIREALAE